MAEEIPREGSFLRGRTIRFHRPLFKKELRREGWPEDSIVPALELDDGTLVYADPEAKAVRFLIGYVPTEPEGERKKRFKFKIMEL